jgi:cytochrome c553
MQRSLLAILLPAVTVSVVPGAHAAGNAADGKKKTAMCEGCHGIPGWRNAYPEVFQVPHLGGQHAKYLISALNAYKKGERPNTTMQSIAAQLSDQDMQDLAAYYSARGGERK